ncbi:MAG: diaminobutyrate--2-oxoglutarate transaminase family protein [Pseudonocardiaceae bacterium]
MQHCHDVLGIGFGPANIALAAAFEEAVEQGEVAPLGLHFLEACREPVWQGGMLLDGSNIQNHPIRDLVTLRNPRSHYSFVNYLHQAGRLLEHLNLPGEFPLRKEYAQYISWVRRHFDRLVDYGQTAAAIRVIEHNDVPAYEVCTSEGRRYRARALVMAPGRTPYLPAPFDAVADDRICHLTGYLYRLDQLDQLADPPRTVAVIGGSQSAVEITLDLAKRYPQARVLTFVRSFGLRLKDTSPFSEEGFFLGFVDYYYRAPRASKRVLDAYMRPTNYSTTDADVLHELYLMLYEQRLDGAQRVFVYGNRQVSAVTPGDRAVSLTVEEVHTGDQESVDADLVILATGFRDLGPGPRQEPYPALLTAIADRFRFDEDGYLAVDQGYRVLTTDPDMPPLFLNGLCETSHGIGDAGSFSLLSLRAAIIRDRLSVLAPGRRTASAAPAEGPGRPVTGPLGHRTRTRTFHEGDLMATLVEPRVRTAVPGPVSRGYLARQEALESNARSYPRRLPIAVRRAEGALVEDVDGNVYLDFLCGAGVLSLGHSHPEIVAAVQAQLSTFVHGLDLPTPAKDRFTELQLSMLPEQMRDRMRVHFCGPTGANAIEAAIKLCKIATGRGEIIAFQGGFHGSTAGAMAVTADLHPKKQVPNGMPGVHFFPYSYCVRCPVGLIPETCATNCATYLERALADPNGGVPNPAAVLVEVVQGEGGGIPAKMAFLRRVREVTRRASVPLIVDEVQTGCGRTGTWFAFEQYGIEPDVIVASKALSGIGVPVAIILYDKALDHWGTGAHIGTFRGNQLAFAGGIAAIEVIQRDNVLENVQQRGVQLARRLRRIADRSPWVVEARGLGLMQCLELTDPDTGTDATAFAREVQAAALRNGLILEVGGRNDCVLRLLPPLTVTEELVDKGADLLERAFAQVDPTFPDDDLAVATPGRNNTSE